MNLLVKYVDITTAPATPPVYVASSEAVSIDVVIKLAGFVQSSAEVCLCPNEQQSFDLIIVDDILVGCFSSSV